MTPEGKVVAYLKKRAKENGFEYRKLHYEGRRGCPDALVFAHGVIAFIECKSAKGRPTREQSLELFKLGQTPAITAIVHNNEEVDEVVERMAAIYCESMK